MGRLLLLFTLCQLRHYYGATDSPFGTKKPEIELDELDETLLEEEYMYLDNSIWF